MNKKLFSTVLASILLLSGCTQQYAQAIENPGSIEVTKSTQNIKEVKKYQLSSLFLKNPDKLIEIADKSAACWIKAYDEEDGGFYTYINQDGTPDTTKPYKVTFLQARDAYGLVRAYQLTGKKEYLDYARKGLDFMYQHGWDEENGGWYQELNKDGTPATQAYEGMEWNNFKFTFNQLYCLTGINAMYDATRNEKDKEWLDKTYEAIIKNLWDSRPEYKGFYEMTNKDWSGASSKSLGTSMDAITSALMPMYLSTLDGKYKEKLNDTANNLLYASKTMDLRDFGIIEGYDVDWKPLEDYPETNSGIFLKPAWSLAMTYLMDPKLEYKETAKKFINELLDSDAYDYVNGGPYNTINPKTGEPIDKKKNWWVIEEAVNSGLTNYYISKDERFLKMADESMNFFMNYIYDNQYGDVYNDTDADGKNPSTMKGNYWKGCYHSQELFYNTYLYGNLMLHNKEASLHYSLEASDKSRDITLIPVLLGDQTLTIKSITLNGDPFNDFNEKTRKLTIPAHVSGQLKVTFKPATFSK